MTAREVPPEWAKLLIDAGLTDPRNGKASMSRLGEAADTHASTVGHAMFGTRNTTAEKAQQIADAIAKRTPGSPERARRQALKLISDAMGRAKPFKPHADADLLEDSERKVVNDLIGLLTRSRRRRQGKGEHTLYLIDDEAAYEGDPEDPPGGEDGSED